MYLGDVINNSSGAVEDVLDHGQKRRAIKIFVGVIRSGIVKLFQDFLLVILEKGVDFPSNTKLLN